MRPEQWAERNDGLISSVVAASSGLSPDQMKRRRSSGRYRTVHRGVSAVAGAPITWQQMARAAVLAAGPDVALGHITAVRWLGAAAPESDTIHLSGPSGRLVRLEGVTSHRFGTLEPNDVITVRGVRCTSPLRTVIDVSGAYTVRALGELVDHFLRTKTLQLDALRERIARTRPAPGRSLKRLRIVLAARLPGYDPGESPLEARIARIVDRAGLPRPSQQHKVRLGGRRYRIDFAWPDRKLYLEGNGFGFHSLSSDLTKDAERQNELVLDGWTPIEITWSMSDARIEHTLRRFVDRVCAPPGA